ncbi:rhodanese-like domain-containing protein [uncultured Demequina sp.]|uniref:rhodanese-like domain-containing protein n=1 Tax=uncultured Demequina sp. TaxID=693499 RepID=UPI0025E4AA14|nr:rhodanese-like domain-containing protein [uncultured Demequina sp.]
MISSRLMNLPRLLKVGALAAALAVSVAACSAPDGGADQDLAAVASVQGDAAPEFTGAHVDAASFAAAVAEPGVTIIDVRTPEEFAQGHLPGAVNINLQHAGFAEAIGELDADASYAVYCRSGNRSRGAIEVMTAAGIDATVGLEGGIGAWAGEVVTG